MKTKIKAEMAVPNRIGNLPAVGQFQLLPCAPDVCQKCATNHAPEQPHNQQSLYYQYWFYSQYGRWPTWADALKHCADDVKNFWTQELGKRGITV